MEIKNHNKSWKNTWLESPTWKLHSKTSSHASASACTHACTHAHTHTHYTRHCAWVTLIIVSKLSREREREKLVTSVDITLISRVIMLTYLDRAWCLSWAGAMERPWMIDVGEVEALHSLVGLQWIAQHNISLACFKQNEVDVFSFLATVLQLR